MISILTIILFKTLIIYKYFIFFIFNMFYILHLAVKYSINFNFNFLSLVFLLDINLKYIKKITKMK
jgi:hypothetical protein